MRTVFVDTSFYAAIANPRDMWHSKAWQAGNAVVGPLVTTEFVLLEVANFSVTGDRRGTFCDLLTRLRRDPAVEIVPASPTDFQRGLDLFAARADKEWSLTDCISFVIMHERGITEALTADQHFEQAGFQALLRQ